MTSYRILVAFLSYRYYDTSPRILACVAFRLTIDPASLCFLTGILQNHCAFSPSNMHPIHLDAPLFDREHLLHVVLLPTSHYRGVLYTCQVLSVIPLHPLTEVFCTHVRCCSILPDNPAHLEVLRRRVPTWSIQLEVRLWTNYTNPHNPRQPPAAPTSSYSPD